MSLKLLKKLIPFKIKRNFKESFGVPSLHWSLENLKRKGFKPEFVIDIGAYEGNWAKDFIEVFPNTHILMIEAQEEKKVYLEKIMQKYPSISFKIALLSSENNQLMRFSKNETASHVVHSSENTDTYEELSSITLDTIIEKNYPRPNFLKLDVQGHELSVLNGANNALAFAEICLLEVSLLDLGDNTPLLAEVVEYMDGKGFQAYDISQFMRRPFDKALYQIDLWFVKKDSFLIAEKIW